MHPNTRARAQQQQRIRRRADHSDAYTFFNLLTSPELLDRVESLVYLLPPTLLNAGYNAPATVRVIERRT
jgi:hypothetical protein